MLFLAIFAVLTASALTSQSFHSFSPPVGQGYGTSYSLTGEGSITAIRVWGAYYGYIRGLQLRFGTRWSQTVGYNYGYRNAQTLELFEGERIVQISGTYSHYVTSLIIGTNKGRYLFVGYLRGGHTFNMYPENSQAELVALSGRHSGPLTSVGAHWGLTTPY